MKLGRLATCALFPLTMLIVVSGSHYDQSFFLPLYSVLAAVMPVVLSLLAALAASGMVWKLNSRLSPETPTQGRVCAVISFASVLIGLWFSSYPALFSVPVLVGAGVYLVMSFFEGISLDFVFQFCLLLRRPFNRH